MLIDELIFNLINLSERHGNLPVYINQSCQDFTHMLAISVTPSFLRIEGDHTEKMDFEEFERLEDGGAVNCIVIADEE